MVIYDIIYSFKAPHVGLKEKSLKWLAQTRNTSIAIKFLFKNWILSITKNMFMKNQQRLPKKEILLSFSELFDRYENGYFNSD